MDLGSLSWRGDLIIKITKTPEGSAPSKIREQWVGVIIPEAAEIEGELKAEMEKRGGVAQVAAERGGVKVPLDNALEALREKSPEAAQWFEENIPKTDNFLAFAPGEYEIVRSPQES